MKPDQTMARLALFLCSVFAPLGVGAQQPTPGAGGVVLREGIVIHPTRAEAYVMAPQGGIAAIDLASGEVRWTSSDADKPLALLGNILVGQREPRGTAQRSQLELVGLDVREHGAKTVVSSVALEPEVRVSLGETLDGVFSVKAHPADGSVLVGWTYRPAPLRGMPPAPVETEAHKGEALAAPPVLSGAVRLDLGTGATTKFDLEAALAPPEPRWLALASEIPSAPRKLPRYVSGDGLHVLVSERVGDGRTWDKYRWTVYERATQNRLGEIRSHVSFAPFVVKGSVLVFETTPFTRAGAKEEAAQLRGVSLETGEQLWSVPVREIVWRGPFPP